MSCGIFLSYLGPSFQDSTVITHALNYCVKSDIQQAKWHYHERKYPETTQISYFKLFSINGKCLLYFMFALNLESL